MSDKKKAEFERLARVIYGRVPNDNEVGMPSGAIRPMTKNDLTTINKGDVVRDDACGTGRVINIIIDPNGIPVYTVERFDDGELFVAREVELTKAYDGKITVTECYPGWFFAYDDNRYDGPGSPHGLGRSATEAIHDFEDTLDVFILERA